MVELYTTKDMNELVKLLDVVGNKTDSIGQTILANTYFSKDGLSSRNNNGKVKALVPIHITSTDASRDQKGANSIDLFTIADPAFYEGGVLDFDFKYKDKDSYSQLIDLEGKALFDESKELGLDPKETMSNYPLDWGSQLGSSPSNLLWTLTTDYKSSKSGIHNLIQEHLNTLNENYHTAMASSDVSDSIKESYARMTDF